MNTQDLSKISGLDLKLDFLKHTLIIGNGLTHPTAAANILKNMQEVLLQKELDKPEVLGYEYKGLCKVKDEKKISKCQMRYDCLILRPERLGVEFMKTAGCSACSGWAKLYEVLTGEAWYLLQKQSKKDARIVEEVILLKAKAADKVVIPPGYGYVIINIGEGHLVTCRWVSRSLDCECNSYKMSQGAAYFVLEDNLGARFEVNPYYKVVPNMSLAHPAESVNKLGIKTGLPIYSQLGEGIDKLGFLNNLFKCDYRDVFIFA